MNAPIRLMLWHCAHAYGEIRWRMHGGCCNGYYWAFRFCCNVGMRDWYGRPLTHKIFNRVGWPQW